MNNVEWKQVIAREKIKFKMKIRGKMKVKCSKRTEEIVNL